MEYSQTSPPLTRLVIFRALWVWTEVKGEPRIEGEMEGEDKSKRSENT